MPPVDERAIAKLSEALDQLQLALKHAEIASAARQSKQRMDEPSSRQRSSSLPARLPSSTKSKRSPALLLSEEALDAICHHISSFPSRYAIPTLSAFSQTTRHWLHPGQRALFRQPLRAMRMGGPGASRVAQNLADALKKPVLAGYVRSLDELASTASSLEEALEARERKARKARQPLLHAPKLRSFHHDDYRLGERSEEDDEEEGESLGAPTTAELSSAFAWSLQLLRSCPRITRASFPIGTESQARRMAKLIKSHLPQLQRIRLISTDEFLLESEVLESFLLACEGLRPFERLTLEGIDWDEIYDEEFSRGGLPLDFKELVLLEADIPWTAAIHSFLPLPPATLTTLHISTYSYPQPAELVDFLRNAGAHLTTFAIHTEDSDPDLDEPDSIESYGDMHEGYILSPTFFLSTPPSLRSLTLRHGSQLLPESLLALAHSSPQLKHLDLQGTIWSTSDPDHYCGCPHWEEIVCLAIEHFGRLEALHLGTLPLTVGMKLPRLEEICRERGIQVQWACCEEEEEGDTDGAHSEDDTEEEVLDRWAIERGAIESESSGTESDEIDEWVDEEDAGGETDEEEYDGDLGRSNIDSDVD